MLSSSKRARPVDIDEVLATSRWSRFWRRIRAEPAVDVSTDVRKRGRFRAVRIHPTADGTIEIRQR